MLLPALLWCALAAAAAAPVVYDERQDGDFNVRADVKNVMLLVAVPKMGQLLTPSILDFVLTKSAGGAPPREPELQERADIHVMEAFVEPSTPYRVEIGTEGERYSDGDGRAVEVVIAGRRRVDAEAQAEDEFKLLGATEQCGPESERDPVTLTCRARAAPPDADDDSPLLEHKDEISAVQPEVVLASS